MEFTYLKHKPEFIPQIANWYFELWGYLMETPSVEIIKNKLQTQLNSNKIPLVLLLIENDKLLGACQLKFHEMDIYPEKEHWLGGVYICHKQRGKGLAKKMVIKAKDIANSLCIKTLYLQTENLTGGIYAHLGWKPIEQITNKGEQVLVMQCDLTLEDK
jgi:GNAT superfamily N-acetyltransferase